VSQFVFALGPYGSAVKSIDARTSRFQIEESASYFGQVRHRRSPVNPRYREISNQFGAPHGAVLGNALW
jgi:hypothetical protein